MREAGLVGVHRRRTRGNTKRDPVRPSYADLVKREFTPDIPDRLWVADITQHKTAEGWLYLAVVIDAYSRKVVGWSMAENLQAELVIKALEMAVWNRQPSPDLIHHSDHGLQYTSLAFGQRLEQAHILGSMGTVGDALDNAVADTPTTYNCYLRVHRSILQPPTAPLHLGLFEPNRIRSGVCFPAGGLTAKS